MRRSFYFLGNFALPEVEDESDHVEGAGGGLQSVIQEHRHRRLALHAHLIAAQVNNLEVGLLGGCWGRF